MTSKITKNLRVFNANKFNEAISSQEQDRTYLFIGYSRDWANNAAPPTPEVTPESVNYDYWRYMIAAKKVKAADVSNVIRRYEWTANTVYRQYDSTDNNLFDTPEASNTFFIVTDDNNVYKCLYNAQGAPSTDKPVGTTTTSIETDDEYIWKFMYTISGEEATKFKTNTYIPIKTLESDDSSAQWAVQQAAVNGAISSVFVANGGTGYLTSVDNPAAVTNTTIELDGSASSTSDIYNGSTIFIAGGLGLGQIREIIDYDGINRRATINTAWSTTPNTSSTYHVSPKIQIKGDGNPVTAYANVSSGSIQKVNLISSGGNYSYANASVMANSGSGAVIYPSLSPKGGHGSDPVSELAGHNVMISVELDRSESNTISTNNDFRQIGLVVDPIERGGSVANSAIYSQTTDLNVENISGGSFIEDERIVDDNTNSVGYVLTFANTNSSGTEGVLSLTDISNGQFGTTSITSENGVTATVNAISLGELKENTGELLYIQNRSAIERATDQKEDFKLTVTF